MLVLVGAVKMSDRIIREMMGSIECLSEKFNQEIIDMPDLHIPHIDLHNRDFVLVPMNQIAPYLRHPVLNQTISQLLDSLLNKSENTAK